MKELKKRDQVNPEDLWNISAVYEDTDQYEADYKKIKQLIAEFSALKGTIKDAASYLHFAKKEEEIERLLGKLFVYGNLKYNEDMTNQDMQTLNQRGRALFTQYGEVSSFAEPEILDIIERDVDRATDANTDRNFNSSAQPFLQNPPIHRGGWLRSIRPCRHRCIRLAPPLRPASVKH